MFVLFNFTSFN